MKFRNPQAFNLAIVLRKHLRLFLPSLYSTWIFKIKNFYSKISIKILILDIDCERAKFIFKLKKPQKTNAIFSTRWC